LAINVLDAALIKQHTWPSGFETKYSIEGGNAISVRQNEEMPDRRRPLDIDPEALPLPSLREIGLIYILKASSMSNFI
jgi:hypothetical protein